jgi:hypothetical protein
MDMTTNPEPGIAGRMEATMAITTTTSVKYHGWTLPKGSTVEAHRLTVCEFTGRVSVTVTHPRHAGCLLSLPTRAVTREAMEALR